jgi:uncharacterized cupredoxin-like copper-binding protein
VLIALPFVVAVAAASMALAAHAAPAARKVSVTEREYKITVASTLKAGATSFVVSNHGKLAHALDISGPGVAKKTTGLISPGKSKTLAVTLKSGTYKLWCPVPGHAALGMKATVKIAGGSSSGGSSGTSSGGSGSSWA